MDAATLFKNTMDWLRREDTRRFRVEDDVVLAVEAQMKQKIQEDGLPYTVDKECILPPGGRADLAIFGADGSVLVAVEFKFEPHRSRLASTQAPRVIWTEFEDDIRKLQAYVGPGRVHTAYSILIDEDGRWRHRRSGTLEGSEWRDWGNGVSALWTKRGGDAAYKAPPAGAADAIEAEAASEESKAEVNWVPLTSKESMEGSLPLTLRFPDESCRTLREWNDLLPQTVGWLWESGRLTMNDIPVRSGPKRFIANIRPYHTNETNERHFDFPKKVEGTPLVVETDTGDQETARKRAVKLLRGFDVDPSSVLVLR